MQLAVVSEAFDSAMALMDELDESGAARGARTEDYAHRTPGIVNALLAELRAMTGARWRCMDVRGMDAPLPGVEETGTPYAVVENRVEAIHYAIDHALPGDVIVLCGKGHEDYQEINHQKHHLDEREVVAEYLALRRRKNG